MTDEVSLQPTSASLSAKIIRACTVHRTCPLMCAQRRVEDLGEIASFSSDSKSLPRRIGTWLEYITHRGGGQP